MDQETFINRFIDEFGKSLPETVKTAKSDVQYNARALLSELFSKMELVTREEFDVQAKVLARTRQKLEMMDIELKKLEQKLEQQSKD